MIIENKDPNLIDLDEPLFEFEPSNSRYRNDMYNSYLDLTKDKGPMDNEQLNIWLSNTFFTREQFDDLLKEKASE